MNIGFGNQTRQRIVVVFFMLLEISKRGEDIPQFPRQSPCEFCTQKKKGFTGKNFFVRVFFFSRKKIVKNGVSKNVS